MRIINLQSENVKRISAVSITPEGALVEITGKNRNGKTSVLDSIWWALTGKTNIQAQPIRAGQEKASIILTLGDPGSEKRLKVTRTFRLKKAEEGAEQDPTQFTTTVTVENEEGFKTSTPQDMLDTLVGALTFDPLQFLKAEPKRQLLILKDLVGVDFTKLDAEIKEAFTKRTDVNRDAASYQAQANAILIPADLPEERPDVDALIAQLENASTHNAEIEQAKRALADIERAACDHDRRVKDWEEEVESLEQRLVVLRENIEETRTKAKTMRAEAEEALKLNPLAEPIDAAAVRADLDEARRIDALFDKVDGKKALHAKATKAQAEADDLTKTIKAKKDEKAKMVAEAKMPIEGLDFGEDGVILRGVPFEQASDAEQLETSIAIAAAMNPKLRIVRVRDGSLMDSDAMARLEAFAEKNDLQVWVETVQSGRAGAIVMVDGHVEGAEPVDEQPELIPA